MGVWASKTLGVDVFAVGGTSGSVEWKDIWSFDQKYTLSLSVIFGRNREAASNPISNVEALNLDAKVIFVKAECKLLKEVSEY